MTSYILQGMKSLYNKWKYPTRDYLYREGQDYAAKIMRESPDYVARQVLLRKISNPDHPYDKGILDYMEQEKA